LLVLTLAGSLAILAGLPAAWLATRPDAAAGELPFLAADWSEGAGVAARPLRLGGPPVEARPARLADLGVRKRPRPLQLQIPRLGIRAGIMPAGVEGRGRLLELPDDGRRIAWYRFGPGPGEPGSAVLAAHVDYEGRPGAFYELRRLEPGDRVVVRLSGGRNLAFRVAARRTYAKDALPRRLFASRGRPVLTLVTCGGSYDERTRSYARNVVVVAVPER